MSKTGTWQQSNHQLLIKWKWPLPNLLSSDPYHNTKALYQEHTHQNPVLDLLKPTATVVTAHSSEPDRGLRKGISSSEVSFFQLSVSLHIHNSNITGSVFFHFVISNPNSTAILVQFSPPYTSIPYPSSIHSSIYSLSPPWKKTPHWMVVIPTIFDMFH